MTILSYFYAGVPERSNGLGLGY